jgi:hypothetical protein
VRTVIAISLIAVVVGLLPRSGYGQEGAKSIFYSSSGATVQTQPAPTKRAPGAAKASSDQYIGLTYWIELVSRDGQRRRVTTDHAFRSGDRFKLHLQSNRAGYLTVVNVGSTGRTTMLFPPSSSSPASNAIRARETYAVPPDEFIRFDDNPGEETLLVMLSPRPMAGMMDQSGTSVGSASSEDLGRLVAKGSKDLLLEVDTTSREPASYAVTPLPSLREGTIMTLRIKLTHQ